MPQMRSSRRKRGRKLNATSSGRRRRNTRLSILTDGFLAKNAPSNVVRVVPQLARVRKLAFELNRFSIGLLQHPRPAPKTRAEELATALMGRLVCDYEAAVLLADRGFRSQSRSMARSTFETALYCVAAWRDLSLVQGLKRKGESVKFVDAVVGGHQRFRKQTATELARMPKLDKGIKARLQMLQEDLGDALNDVDIKGLAEDLGLGNLYTVLYRQLSQDAHPTVTSAGLHVVASGDGETLGFRIGPDYEQYSGTLLASIAAVLLAIAEFVERKGTPVEKGDYAHFLSAYKLETESEELLRAID